MNEKIKKKNFWFWFFIVLAFIIIFYLGYKIGYGQGFTDMWNIANDALDSSKGYVSNLNLTLDVPIIAN